MNKREFNELQKEWIGVELDLDDVSYTVDRITNRGELGVVDEDGNQMIISIEDVYYLDDEDVEFNGEAVEDLVTAVVDEFSGDDVPVAPFPHQEDEEPYVDNEDEGDVQPPKKRKKTSKTD